MKNADNIFNIIVGNESVICHNLKKIM